MTTISFTIPVRTVSEANAHEHWRPRQKRAKQQRGVALMYAHDLPPLPAIVMMTRLAPNELDSDNLAGSMKHVRDGIADAYEVDDGDKRYDWRYAQEKSKEYGVRIEITPLSAQTNGEA